MSGDDAKVLALWKEMVGATDFVSEDLEWVWPVRLGEHTESLNLLWYQNKMGRLVTRKGEVVIHPGASWAACTLDGWDDAIPAPIECKHVGGYERREVVIARYQPQCHWQMIVTRTDRVLFSVIEGAKEPVVEIIPFDADYAAELWRRAEAFMGCVWSLTPPIDMPPVAPPIQAVKEVDFAHNNLWCDLAGQWLSRRDAAKQFQRAEKDLKGMVEPDVRRACGAGIEAVRNKAGALQIREAR